MQNDVLASSQQCLSCKARPTAGVCRLSRVGINSSTRAAAFLARRRQAWCCSDGPADVPNQGQAQTTSQKTARATEFLFWPGHSSHCTQGPSPLHVSFVDCSWQSLPCFLTHLSSTHRMATPCTMIGTVLCAYANQTASPPGKPYQPRTSIRLIRVNRFGPSAHTTHAALQAGHAMLTSSHLGLLSIRASNATANANANANPWACYFVLGSPGPADDAHAMQCNSPESPTSLACGCRSACMTTPGICCKRDRFRFDLTGAARNDLDCLSLRPLRMPIAREALSITSTEA